MRKSLVLIAALLLVAAIPAMAARVATLPITHETQVVYQAYPCEGDDSVPPICPTCGSEGFAGYRGTMGNTITSVPGILSIVPGENWENFVGAAQDDVPYVVKNVVLCKQTPMIVQCADRFPADQICQQGTPNIRLWWPLMYEVPGTCWTLTIIYGTPTPYDDDGPMGPNPAGYVHTEVWQWCVEANLGSLSALLELFHELPFGLDEVPIISDEVLYPILQAKIDAIEAALEPPMPDLVAAGLILGDFEMEVMNACIPMSPMTPSPTGPGTGIANSLENPACCKLLADAEFIGFAENIFQPTK